MYFFITCLIVFAINYLALVIFFRCREKKAERQPRPETDVSIRKIIKKTKEAEEPVDKVNQDSQVKDG